MGTFREYKEKNPRWKPRRRIPIGRGLLLLACIYAVYASGAVQKASHYVEKWRDAEKKTERNLTETWRESCEKFGGQSFPLQKEGLGQCSWMLRSGEDVLRLPEIPFLRYVGSRDDLGYPSSLHWIADSLDFWKPVVLGVERDGASDWFFYVMLEDSTERWVREDGCLYPGVCPRNPLSGGALPIASDFDFAGRENLLLKDLFMGIGEAPVFPILPARVVSVSKDSSGYGLLLDHGGNIFSRVSSLFALSPEVREGALLSESEPVGRLAPSDSAVVFIEVLRNGRFVRWDDFFRASHVVSASDVRQFRSELGF